MDDDSDEMVFPLTSQQNSALCAWIPLAILDSKDKECQMALKIRQNQAKELIKNLTDQLKKIDPLGAIRLGAQPNVLKLRIPAGAKAAIHARHLLERRLGVLMTYEEVAHIRK